MFVRQATLKDALEVKKIHVRAYQISYKGYIPDKIIAMMKDNEDNLEQTRQYLAQKESYVAVKDDAVIGFAHLNPLQDGTFEIMALYVNPDYQNQGAGSLLIKEICHKKQQEGARKCILWTLKNGPSLGFYRKLGFEQTSAEKIWKESIPIVMLEKIL